MRLDGRGRRARAVDLAQILSDHFVIGWFRKKVSLCKPATQDSQLAHLLFRFCSFRNRDQTKVLSQHHDNFHNGAAFRVAVHTRNESPVDLERVDRELL